MKKICIFELQNLIPEDFKMKTQQDNDYLSIGSDELFAFENKRTSGRKHFEKYIKLTPPVTNNFINSSKAIIDDDDQKGVDEEKYPYNCIARLIIRSRDGKSIKYGTGFFISKQCLITAGHNIYFNREFAKDVTVIPGANEYKDAPYGKATTTTLRCMEKWAYDHDNNYDYGAVILQDDSLFNKVKGYFDYESPETFDVGVELCGYPVETVEKKGAQWKSEGKIDCADKNHLHYQLDTEPGQSGSPVFVRKGKSCVVIGVHHRFETCNHAIRVNEMIVSKWNEWAEIKPKKI